MRHRWRCNASVEQLYSSTRLFLSGSDECSPTPVSLFFAVFVRMNEIKASEIQEVPDNTTPGLCDPSPRWLQLRRSHTTVMFDMCQKQLSALLLQKRGSAVTPLSQSFICRYAGRAQERSRPLAQPRILLLFLLLSLFSIDAWHYFFNFHDQSD